MKLARCWWVGVVLLGVVGCSGPGNARERFQERIIADADTDVVLAEAAAVLRREFGRVAMDDNGRRLVTQSVEFVTERESGTARDLYRGRSTMRRSATFDVGRRGEAVIARIRIDVEREDTVRQRVMHPRGYRLSDTPGSETAVDRDAATTEAQNTTWTYVRRDRRLERALLDELRERLAPEVVEPAQIEEKTESASPAAAE